MTELQKVKDNPISVIEKLLGGSKDQIQKALPKKMSADRLIRVAITELRKNPQLACDPISFCGAIVQCAQLGLEPGGPLGQAYLVKYGDKVQLLIGYRGMINLAMRSGEVSNIYAHAVYEGDDFSYTLGTNPSVLHIPVNKSDKITHVYAVAQLRAGFTQVEVMTRDQIEYIRNTFSKGKNSDAWVKSFGEMARKTVIRRLIKTLPTNVELAEALAHEDDLDAIEIKPNVEKFKEVVAAPEIICDSQAEQTFKEFKTLCADAEARAVDIKDIVTSEPDKFLKETDIRKLVAVNAIIKATIQSARQQFE